MFLLQLLLHRLTLIIPPLPPPKKKNWQNCRFVSLETFVKSAQNQLLSSEIGLTISAKLTFLTIVFLAKFVPNFSAKFRKIGRFFCEFISENPTKFGFFFTTYQRPCVMNGLHYKTSWSGGLFLPLLQLFSFMNFKIVQSWPIIVFKKSERLNYIRSVKEQTKCPAI